MAESKRLSSSITDKSLHSWLLACSCLHLRAALTISLISLYASNRSIHQDRHMLPWICLFRKELPIFRCAAESTSRDSCSGSGCFRIPEKHPVHHTDSLENWFPALIPLLQGVLRREVLPNEAICCVRPVRPPDPAAVGDVFPMGRHARMGLHRRPRGPD